jgi:membrane-associated phospholipid phosphatase
MKAAPLLLLFLAPAVAAAEDSRLAWDDSWPRFSKTEYLVTGLAAVDSAAQYFLVPPPKAPAWKGDILFDKYAGNALSLSTEKGRNRANDYSDILTYPMLGYAMLDGPITAGLVGKNKDTAIQLSLINAQTLAVTEALNLTISNVLPRSRPQGALCASNSKYDPDCVKSFWSGHAATAFASASLLCLEHGELALYGGKSDTVVCVGALLSASLVGALRIAGDDHHASDVIVGAAVGAGTGYLMPKLLHFKSKKSRHRLGYLIPSAGPKGGGLTYVKDW